MTGSERNLVFLWPYVEWGGAQIYCLAIMKLARERWTITVIIPRNSSQDLLAMLEGVGAKVNFIDSALDLGSAPTLLRKLRRQFIRIRTEIEAYRALSRFPFDQSVLHIDFAPWQSWLLYTLLAIRGACVFVTLHNFFSEIPRWRELIFRIRLQILSRVPGFHILASNHDTRNKLKGWVAEAFWERLPVTYTCVDPVAVEALHAESIDRSNFRRTNSLPEEEFIVLTVGQFVDRKGRWTLLEAAQKAARIDKEIKFIWVTPSLPGDQEIERISSYRLGDQFKLILSSSLGNDRLAVLRFFTTADCFVLPSFIEGLPIAVLEAMALGLPTISTNVFAIPEAVIHEETGLLINAGDSDDLCRTILRLKNDRPLAMRLSENGRRFVLEHFDEREASRIAIAAYEDCLNGK